MPVAQFRSRCSCFPSLSHSLPIKSISQFPYQRPNTPLYPWSGDSMLRISSPMDLDGLAKATSVSSQDGDRRSPRSKTKSPKMANTLMPPSTGAVVPPEQHFRVVLRGLYCDGKNDLFTFGQIACWWSKTTTQPEKQITWKKS